MVIKKNILVTGSNGQLGSCLKYISSDYNHNFIFKGKNDLDITDFYRVEDFINKNKINIIINCAAYTNVNLAEINLVDCRDINSNAVDNIAKLCYKLNIQLIHISTDYVFGGKKQTPYNENDRTNPINFYGLTKLEGEKNVLKYDLKDSMIIRTSWLYSNLKSNFLNKIIKKIDEKSKIKVVHDEVGSPTNAYDLAKIILDIIPNFQCKKTQIYHFSNLGFCSRYEFAKKIAEIVKKECFLTPINNSSSSLKRPKFSALDSSKIMKNFGIQNNPWQTSLKTCLELNFTNLSYEI